MDADVVNGCDIDTDGEDSVVIGGGVDSVTGGEESGVDRGSIATDEEEADVDVGITISLLCRREIAWFPVASVIGRSSETSSFSPYSTRGLLEVL